MSLLSLLSPFWPDSSLLLLEKQEYSSVSRFFLLDVPGDVIVHSVSCLLVMDPVADENAGGLFGQLTGAQHAVTVPLPVTEAALVHLATGIPEHST